MTVWGDEFGRTQNGNNNADKIDSVAIWHNDGMIATGDAGAYHDDFGTGASADDVSPPFRIAAFLARLRQQHPCLRQRKYGDWLMDSGEDVTDQLRRPDGISALSEGDRCVWLRIDGSAVGNQDFLVLINMDSHRRDFVVPAHAGRAWTRILDTADWAEIDCSVWRPQDRPATIVGAYEVAAWSVAVLEEIASWPPPREASGQGRPASAAVQLRAAPFPAARRLEAASLPIRGWGGPAATMAAPPEAGALRGRRRYCNRSTGRS